MTTARIAKKAVFDAAIAVMQSAQAEIDEMVKAQKEDGLTEAYAARERAEEIAVLCEKTIDDYITMSGCDCLWLLG